MMKKRQPSLAKNAILNTIKQCCVIIYPMITFPYVSRVLGAENYGKINFGQSIVSYISLIASLGIYQYAIREGAKKRDNRHDLNQLLSEIFTVNVLSTILAFSVFGGMLLFWPKLVNYRTLLLVQVSVVLFTTLGADWINSVFEDYWILTVRYIFFHGIAILLMFLLVRSKADYIVYAGIVVLSSAIPNFMNIFYIRRQYGVKVGLVRPASIRKHLTSVLILFASSVASLVYINSDITILGEILGDYDVGLYSVSAKIYSLVKQLMNAFLYVAIPKVSNELSIGQKENAQRELNIILGVLVSLSIPASTGIFLLSDNIVRLVAGSEYMGAASSLRILAITLFFSSLACFYINAVLLPLGKEKIILVATIVSALINFVLNFMLIPILGRDAAALTTLIAEVVMVLFGIYYSSHDFKFRLIRQLLSGALAACGVVGCYYLTTLCKMQLTVQLLVCVVGSGLIYAAIMLLINRRELKAVIAALK